MSDGVSTVVVQAPSLPVVQQQSPGVTTVSVPSSAQTIVVSLTGPQGAPGEGAATFVQDTQPEMWRVGDAWVETDVEV